jgi:hypothetical protein
MESLDRVVLVLKEETEIVKKKMRKLRDKSRSDSVEFYDLRIELDLLERAWDILV